MDQRHLGPGVLVDGIGFAMLGLNRMRLVHPAPQSRGCPFDLSRAVPDRSTNSLPERQARLAAMILADLVYHRRRHRPLPPGVKHN